MRNVKFHPPKYVGVRFKKWECCTPILPKGLVHFLNFSIFKKNIKIFKRKRATFWQGYGQRVTVGHWLVAARCPKLALCKKKFLPLALFFLHM